MIFLLLTKKPIIFHFSNNKQQKYYSLFVSLLKPKFYYKLTLNFIGSVVMSKLYSVFKLIP